MPLSFAEDIALYADAGCDAIEVWLTKLENHLQIHSLDDTRRLLGDRGITLAAAAYQGGLLLAQGEARKVHYELYRRRLDLCQQLGIRTLIVVADFTDKVDESAMPVGLFYRLLEGRDAPPGNAENGKKRVPKRFGFGVL